MGQPAHDIPRVYIQTNLRILQLLYVALLVRYGFIFLVAPPLGREPNGVMWILAELPLLIFAYGIYTGKRRWVAGFCYTIIPYFMVAGANLFVPQLAWYLWSGVLLFIAAFISGMMHIRWTGDGVIVSA